jgi:hypothetical protein
MSSAVPRGEDVIPAISTLVTGPLGVMHLPRFWLKNLLHALGRLPPGYKSTTGMFDRMLIETLGLDERAVEDFIKAARPDYLQFEAWIRDHARHLNADVIDELNQRYRQALMSEGGAQTRRAELGLTDETMRGGIILNDLDDWSLLHHQLAGPVASDAAS